MATSSKESYTQLLSLAVHEFRTPASVVGGYLRMLQRDGEAVSLTDRQRKMISEAEKSCARLVALIAELSDISKLDAGLITLARRPLDVFSLVRDVAEVVQEGKDREVRLEARGQDAGAPMMGDATRLRSAFDAIFRAILRETAGPCAVVALRRRATRDNTSSAVIVVAEESCVQTAYESPRGVFNEKRGGLGLALPLARRVIEGHGGEVWAPAASEELARGSIVVTLPIAE